MDKNLRLRIALQKKGRLYQDSIELLTHCGLRIRNSHNALFSHCDNLPIDLLFVRDDDIPTLVADGICDLGIVGGNITEEKKLQSPPEINSDSLIILKSLGFSRCRLSLAVAEGCRWNGPTDLQGKRIATSYPHLLQKYLEKNHVQAHIIHLSGSVEIAPRLGIADFICDLVSSGQTLEANLLKEVAVIMHSQALLIQNNLTLPLEKNEMMNLLLQRIDGVLKAQERKYILFHAPKSAVQAISRLLPGAEAPTIFPLDNYPDKVVVHVVSAEAVFWDTLEILKKAGASSILVLPIEKMLY